MPRITSDTTERLRAESRVWKRLLLNPRLPRAARGLLTLAAGLLLNLDATRWLKRVSERAAIPLLVWLALKLTPSQLLADARAAEAANREKRSQRQAPPQP